MNYKHFNIDSSAPAVRVSTVKLINKYILHSLLVPLGYCLTGFTLFFLIYNLFDTLNDFLDADTAGADMARYYLYALPGILNTLIPITLLIAVLASLSSLTKNNELTAMRASGIGLFRLMTPYIIVGLLATVVVALINETIAPYTTYWADRLEETENKKQEGRQFDIFNSMIYKNRKDHREWLAQTFNLATYEMTGVNVKQFREDGSLEAQYGAASAEWLDGQWCFKELEVQKFRKDGIIRDNSDKKELQGKSKQAFVTLRWQETPADFLTTTKDARDHPDHLNTREMLASLAQRSNPNDATSIRLKSDLHFRIAQPFMCLIAVLLGIPFGAQTGRKGAFKGVMYSFFLFFVSYALGALLIYLAKEGILPPLIAAWTTNTLFFTIACVMIYRMR